VDPEALYRQLGRLLEATPDFYTRQVWTYETHQWVGRADALVIQSGDPRDAVDWRTATANLETQPHVSIGQMMMILHRVLAAAELNAPPSARGAFIPVGSAFDAFAALSKITRSAVKDLLVVDPYMDETALTELATTVPPGVPLRLLSDQADHKPSLPPAATRWAAQYGTARPLAVRLAPNKSLHDRAIFVDGTVAWTVTQSFKDIAKRLPAEIVKADDTASLKIAAYEAIWSAAAVVV